MLIYIRPIQPYLRPSDNEAAQGDLQVCAINSMQSEGSGTIDALLEARS